MKSAITSCLLMRLAVAGAGRAFGAPRTVGRRPASGQAYVRLTDWAKANVFEVQWLKPDETLELSNHSSKVVLAVDSREAQINGVAVWLLCSRGGAQRRGLAGAA